ncbi:MAG: pyruvate kinase alpha/beta domain-containing protein [Thermodesulfobacteriota bacterium]|nr:pyruvate kinase alpha/beta domain-containing protein [Thermodesulfobacteriota bacterium]
MPVKEIMVFDTPGVKNTNDCIEIAIKSIKKDGYKHIVVASTTGKTALAFYDALKDLNVNLVIVTHSVGFGEPNTDEFDPKIRDRLLSAGIPVCTGTILSHSLEKSFMDSFGGIYPAYIIANTLRRFGEGTKVAIEIVLEACDAGLIPEGEEVLSIGGTARGSDTILAIKTRPSKRFLDLDVLEILARPRGRDI